MKKMAIVPYKLLEEMNRWKTEHRPKLPPNPVVVQTVTLQKEMESVLNRNDLSEAEKAQQYGQTLQKCQTIREKILYPLHPQLQLQQTIQTNVFWKVFHLQCVVNPNCCCKYYTATQMFLTVSKRNLSTEKN